MEEAHRVVSAKCVANSCTRRNEHITLNSRNRWIRRFAYLVGGPDQQTSAPASTAQSVALAERAGPHAFGDRFMFLCSSHLHLSRFTKFLYVSANAVSTVVRSVRLRTYAHAGGVSAH